LGIAHEQVQYLSVVGDGLGAVTLAALAQNMPQNLSHIAAENSFRSVPINRFDFIDRGVDDSDYFYFKNLLRPPVVFFQGYLKKRFDANPVTQIEFNYHTEAWNSGNAAGSAARKLFAHGPPQAGVDSDFNLGPIASQVAAAMTAPNSLGEAKLSHIVANSQVKATLHTIKETGDGQPDKSVGHAFSYLDTERETILQRKRSAYSKASLAAMPDHASAQSRKTEAAFANQTNLEMVELKEKIDYFAKGMQIMAANNNIHALCGYQDPESEGYPYRRYCNNGFLYLGADGEFKLEYKKWWLNVKRMAVLSQLIDFEINEYPNGLSGLATHPQGRQMAQLLLTKAISEHAGQKDSNSSTLVNKEWETLVNTIDTSIFTEQSKFQDMIGPLTGDIAPGTAQGAPTSSALVLAKANEEALALKKIE